LGEQGAKRPTSRDAWRAGRKASDQPLTPHFFFEKSEVCLRKPALRAARLLRVHKRSKKL